MNVALPLSEHVRGLAKMNEARQQTVFDRPNYRQVTEAEIAWLDRQFPAVMQAVAPRTAIEYGCGIGVFTAEMTRRGIEVLGLDLRPENILEARRRHPQVQYRLFDFDRSSDQDFETLPMVDLGFVFGLLYHLENPFGTLRRVCGQTRSVVMVSTRTAASRANAIYLHHEPEGAAANIRRIAAVPSLAAVLTGLEAGGFPYIYRPAEQPDHPQWKGEFGNGQRHSLIAFRKPVEHQGWPRLASPGLTRKWEALGLE